MPADPDQPGLGAVTLGVLRVSARRRARATARRCSCSATPPATRPSRQAAILAGAGVARPAGALHADRAGPPGRRQRTSSTARPDDARAAIVDADPAAGGRGALGVLLEQARAIVQECNLTLDGGLGIYRTAATAADVELLRAALGVERLSAVGIGDGAAALAEWARTAPASVGTARARRPAEPDARRARPLRVPRGRRRGRVRRVRRGLHGPIGLPAGCRPARHRHRAASGSCAPGRWRRMTAARLTAGARPDDAAHRARASRATWPALASALAAAGAGDPAPMLTLLAPVVGPRGRYDGMLATSCNDTRRRLAPGEIGDLAAALAHRRTRCSAVPSRRACWPARRGRRAGRPTHRRRPTARRRSS